MRSSFNPPINYSQGGMQPTQQNPPSPVKGLGYVSGVSGVDRGLNGYVGEKPAVREEPQNPQSRRQMTNFASPDPTLSNQAFTQSQFTTNISAAALQSQAMRACATTGSCNIPNGTNGANGANGGGTDGSESTIEDARLANLRRYKESTRSSRGGSSGYSPHPSYSMQRQQRPSNQTLDQRGDQQQRQGISNISSLGNNGSNNGNIGDNGNDLTTVVSTNHNGTNSGSQPQETFVAYTLSDPGSMYKSFSGTSSWFRVLQVIIPQGKKVKRIYVSSMVLPQDAVGTVGTGGAGGEVYSIRLVDPNNTKDGRLVPLWADYSCTNTDNFKVTTMDLTNISTIPNGGILEIQAQNSDGLPILFASAMIHLDTASTFTLTV